MNRCHKCLRDLPSNWEGRCFLCEDRAKEREGVLETILSHAEIRFLLWAIPQADVWTDKGMRAWAQMGGQDALASKLRRLLEPQPPAPDGC